MTDLRRWLPGLTDEELAALSAVPVPEGHGRVTSLAELVAGWASHVERLSAESARTGADPDDASVWTPDDFVGALHLRNRVAAGIAATPAPLLAAAERAVAAADARFTALTEPDDDGLLDAAVRPGDRLSGWWWHRVPRRGPIRDELVAWAKGREGRAG